MDILDPVVYVRKVWRILRSTLPGIQWGKPRRPLSPKVFNVVVVDAVIRHWVMVVAPTETGTEGLGETI